MLLPPGPGMPRAPSPALRQGRRRRCRRESQALHCVQVKYAWYCNAACQRAHRKAHVKVCKLMEKELAEKKLPADGSGGDPVESDAKAGMRYLHDPASRRPEAGHLQELLRQESLRCWHR